MLLDLMTTRHVTVSAAKASQQEQLIHVIHLKPKWMQIQAKTSGFLKSARP